MLQTSPGAGPSRLPAGSAPHAQSIDLTEESDGEDVAVAGAAAAAKPRGSASMSPTTALRSGPGGGGGGEQG